MAPRADVAVVLQLGGLHSASKDVAPYEPTPAAALPPPHTLIHSLNLISFICSLCRS